MEDIFKTNPDLRVKQLVIEWLEESVRATVHRS